MLEVTQDEHHILMSNKDYITVKISNHTHRSHENANIEFLATVWNNKVRNATEVNFKILLPMVTEDHNQLYTSVHFFLSLGLRFKAQHSSFSFFYFVHKAGALSRIWKPWVNGNPDNGPWADGAVSLGKSHNHLRHQLHGSTWKTLQYIYLEPPLGWRKYGTFLPESKWVLKALTPESNVSQTVFLRHSLLWVIIIRIIVIMSLRCRNEFWNYQVH